MRNLGNYMPMYYDDFIGGTMSFGADEIGAYLLLLCHQWAEGYIENDPVIIERLARCEYGKLRRVLAKFDQTPDGHLINDKCERVRQERMAYLETRLKGAIKGGEANKKRIESIHKASHEDTHKASHEGSPSSSSSSSSSNSPSLSKKTTTTSSDGDGGGGYLIEFKEGATKTEIIDGLSGLRPEYGRIRRAAWEECFKVNGAKPEHFISAANAFIKADTNSTEAYKAPARYFGGIIKKTLEDAGVQTETHGERMERIKREAVRR